MPVHGSWLRQAVVEDDPHTILLVHLNRGPWSAPIEAPGVNRLERTDLLLNHLGDKMKDLRVVLHCVGQVSDVSSHDRHIETWPRMWGAVSFHPIMFSARTPML